MRILTDKKIEGALRCHICGAEVRISENGASLVCKGERRHCCDFAASGYVNMCSPSQSGGGDGKAAVRARSAFLGTELYRPAAEKLTEALSLRCPRGGLVVDAGCGEGYYSTFVAKAGYSVFGADLSKFAVDAASKRAGREGLNNAFFAAASVFALPLADGSADAVINVFAPCAEDEYLRVLKDGGTLAVAYAGEKHLLGLKRAVYDNAYENVGRADLPKKMKLVDELRANYEIELTSEEQIMNLFSMTPYYWRTSPSDAEKLRGMQSLSTEVDIVIAVYEKTEKIEKMGKTE